MAAAMDGAEARPALAPERGVGGRAAAGGAGEAPRRGAGPDAARRADQPSRHRRRSPGWRRISRETRTAFVAVSHDRAFLRNLTDRTLWVDRGEVRRLERGFAAFEAWRDKVFEEEDAARHKLDRLIKAEGRWAVEGISARRTRNQGRVRRLAELRAERRDAIARPGTARLELRGGGGVGAAGGRGGGGHARASAGGRWCGTSRSGSARGERVALVGPNGVGQDDAAEDPDRGDRAGRGAGAARGEPGAGGLRPEPGGARPGGVALGDADRRIARREERPGDGAGRPRHVVGYLKDFLFAEAQARGPVSALSGGRAGAAAARAADGEGVEPAGARRADQRPRRRDARPARGAGRRTTRGRCCWSATTATSSTGWRRRRSRWRATGGR